MAAMMAGLAAATVENAGSRNKIQEEDKSSMEERKWWKERVAYQVYPRSFYDTNNDGTGDLKGIIEKLDYLKELGIGILWISPVYCSPMVDQGYDISDYYEINPIFGSMADMKELIREAKKRDIALLMDLVVNHCSSEHRWFQEAVKDPFGPYGDYFYLKEGKNGQPPTNWRSYFGGSVWDLVPGQENLFYLHSFAKEQPDLNWENPKVREEIYRMVNWWLDQGIAGFRIDAICNIKKDLTWSDLPVDAPDGMGAVRNVIPKVSGIGAFLTELKERCFIPHDAFTVGEVTDFSPQALRAYVGRDGYFNTMFDLGQFYMAAAGGSWADWKEFDFTAWRNNIYESQQYMQQISFVSNAFENHDQPRCASRCLPAEDYGFHSVTALATVFTLLHGLPFIYQGQEFGMQNIQVSDISEYDDIDTIGEYWQMVDQGIDPDTALKKCASLSRDNARSPVLWERSGSLVTDYYRKLIALRTGPSHLDVLSYGKFTPVLEENDHLFAFTRTLENKTILVLANFDREPIQIPEKYLAGELLLNNYEERLHDRLLGYQSVVIFQTVFR